MESRPRRRSPLTIEERRAIVAEINAGRERAPLAEEYRLDPTTIDKIRSGMNENPLYTYETVDNITNERKRGLFQDIFDRKRTFTAVCNGWIAQPKKLREEYECFLKEKREIAKLALINEATENMIARLEYTHKKIRKRIEDLEEELIDLKFQESTYRDSIQFLYDNIGK